MDGIIPINQKFGLETDRPILSRQYKIQKW